MVEIFLNNLTYEHQGLELQQMNRKEEEQLSAEQRITHASQHCALVRAGSQAASAMANYTVTSCHIVRANLCWAPPSLTRLAVKVLARPVQI